MTDCILVTQWEHPGVDMDLILRGSPDYTYQEAKQVFRTHLHLLKGEPMMMNREEFQNLPEFEGMGDK